MCNVVVCNVVEGCNELREGVMQWGLGVGSGLVF